MVRGLGAVVMAAALMVAQTAFADDAAPVSAVLPLAPGPAAGLHAAQGGPDINKIAVGVGVGLAVLAIYLIEGTHYHVPARKNAAVQNPTASGTR